jgi:hypothetical protein
MPRYFFNVQDDRTIIDQEGTELPNLGAAREEAVSTSAELLRCRAGVRFGTESPGGCGLRTKRAGREKRYSGSSFPRPGNMRCQANSRRRRDYIEEFVRQGATDGG